MKLLIEHGANVHARSNRRHRLVNSGNASDNDNQDGTPVDERYVLRSVDPPANIRELTLQDGRLSEVAQPVTDGIEALAALERAHAAYNRRITDRPFDQDTD